MLNSPVVQDFIVYGNIYLNSQKKYEIALQSIALWEKYFHSAPFFLRVRGEYGNHLKDSVYKLYNTDKFHIVVGSDFFRWQNQAIYDLDQLNYKYIFVFLEDHIPSSSAPKFQKIIATLNRDNVDLLQYSWFGQYAKWRGHMSLSDKFTKDEIVTTKIEPYYLHELLNIDYRWLISITGIYKRTLLLRILKSKKPVIKKTNPRAPFDLEKNPRNTEFLPLRFSLPKTELGICVDDDNTIPGSSALSRGIIQIDMYARVAEHHSALSPLAIIDKFRKFVIVSQLFRSIPTEIKLVLGKILLIPTYLVNTIETYIFEIRDRVMKN